MSAPTQKVYGSQVPQPKRRTRWKARRVETQAREGRPSLDVSARISSTALLPSSTLSQRCGASAAKTDFPAFPRTAKLRRQVPVRSGLCHPKKNTRRVPSAAQPRGDAGGAVLVLGRTPPALPWGHCCRALGPDCRQDGLRGSMESIKLFSNLKQKRGLGTKEETPLLDTRTHAGSARRCQQRLGPGGPCTEGWEPFLRRWSC